MTDMNLNSTSNRTNITCRSLRSSPSDVEEPKASETFRTVFMSFIIFFGVVGNALVLRGAINRKKRPFSYYLVINLALAEILICCLQPFQMVVERPPYTWQAGPFMCKVVRGMEVGSSLIVTYTLAAIAAYRATVITQPKINRPSTRVAYGVMAISWIWGAAFSIPYGLNRRLDVHTDTCIHIEYKICAIIKMNSVFDISYKIGFFYVPFAVILASYGVVIYKIKQHSRSEAQKCRKESIELTSTTTTRISVLEENDNHTAQALVAKSQQNPSKSPANPLALKQRSVVNKVNNKDKNKGKIFELEKDVLNLLYILILIFFICYIPWTIQYMLLYIAKEESVTKWPYAKIFEWYKSLIHALPSALHPICYGAASKIIVLRSQCLRWRSPSNKN